MSDFCRYLGVARELRTSENSYSTHCGVPYTTLRDTVFAHPTLSESLNTLFAAIDEDEIQMTSQAEMGMMS